VIQYQIDKAVAKALEACKIIQVQRDVVLIKDSYFPFVNSSLNTIAKELERATPGKDNK
jgi:hypothetical protein